MAVAVGAVVVPGASAATKRIVDNGTVQCPNATFTSIQAAVTAADPGDTVAICPGVYDEQSGENGIVIDKGLTVYGAGADKVTIQPSADIGLAGPESREEGNVIWVDNAGGPVDISGVTVATGGSRAEAGVVFTNTAGTVKRSRVTGLGAPPTVDYSTGAGLGVVGYTDSSALASSQLEVGASLIEGYGKGGVLVDSAGSQAIAGAIHDNVIRGNGPLSAPGQGQNGVQVSGPNARAVIERNVISDNRFTPDESASAGVLLFDANVLQTSITDNDLQGNGYGVFNAGANLCDSPTAVPAANNWWGNPAGPTVDTSSGPTSCPPAVYVVTGSPALGDRVNGAAVTFAPFRTAPRGASMTPGAQPDLVPNVAITSPADGAEAEPGSPVTVTATASDDFDVAQVEFRRGATVVATDTTPPYSAAVNAPAAGASQAITATAFDSAGQTDADAISLRGKAPAQEQPQPQTPQQPAADDQPPSVAITGPGEGTAISPSAPPHITADASDDRGVARVAFLDDGKVVCTDDAAPYDCAYAPTGDDVGRNTLIAIAVDGAGQTGVAFRGVTVARFDPKLTAATTPKRDRKRPYRYTTTGSVVLPAGVTPAQACTAGGSVAIEFRVGKLILPQSTALRPDCSFRSSIAFPSRRSLGRGRLSVATKFGGNAVLGTAKAPTEKVRAG